MSGIVDSLTSGRWDNWICLVAGILIGWACIAITRKLNGGGRS